MTTNGSESLNNVFRLARQLPICVVVEKTFFKCVEWFVERRGVAARWEASGLEFTQRITDLLKNRGDKGRRLEVIPLTWRTNVYDVHNRNGRLSECEYGEIKYEVQLLGGSEAICQCQKPQLTGLPCDHVMAVCSMRRLDHTQFVSKYYTIEYFKNTWDGEFRSFGNKRDWPLWHGPIIRPDPKKINKGRRKKIRIPMLMDEMEDRINRLPDWSNQKRSRRT